MRAIVFDEDGPHDLGNLDVGQVHNVIAGAVAPSEALPPPKETELEFLNDMMACVTDMLDQLASGKLDDIRLGLKGMKDGLSGRIGDLEG